MAECDGPTVDIHLRGGQVHNVMYIVLNTQLYRVSFCKIAVLTFEGSTPSSLTTARDWAAKASFSSNKSTSSTVHPALDSCGEGRVREDRKDQWVYTMEDLRSLTAARTAGTGPIPMIDGSTPA